MAMATRLQQIRSLVASVVLLGLIQFTLAASHIHGKEYFGKPIGNFNSYAHIVAGKLFAVDEDTVLIKNFSYDGLGPDAYFWVGKTSQPSPSGIIVPFPDDYTGKEPPVLRNFNHEDVLLQLPPGYKLKEIKWIAVWCRRYTVNFADVYIPQDLDPPRRRVLPEFKRLAHGLRSGEITILDAKTFYIPDLHYDGAGPDAFFWVGTGLAPHPGGRKIPNEKGSTDVLLGYEGEDIELTLPGDLTVYDIDWLSVWCVKFKHDFGHVIIPKDLNVPPALGEYKTVPNTGYFPYPGTTTTRHKNKNHHKKKTEFSNCKELAFSSTEGQKVQLQWEKDGQDIKFKVSARMPESQYIALGFSPIKGRTKMVGSDAIVIFYTPEERKKFHAVDYYMTAQSQCDGKDGVCPDTRIGGRNDVVVLNGDRRNGFTTVLFKRPIYTGEPAFDILLEEETNIMLAIGNLNTRNEANYHFGERTNPSDDIRIYFNSTNDHNCLLGDDFPNMKSTENSKFKPWPQNSLDGITNFTARIGPTGGKRGYTAITGVPSWGIAWYINDLLIPEIYVERGKTYYFTVEGGDDSKNPAKYHPLYITDNPEGGLGQKKPYEQEQQKVFAGIAYDSSGFPYPTALGRACEWEHKTIDKSSQSETFEQYMKTLKLVCDDSSTPGSLVWKVSNDTPDTVYYQCYTHNNLGWKIHVVNPGIRLRRYFDDSSASKLGHTSYSLISIIFSSFLISSTIVWSIRQNIII